MIYPLINLIHFIGVFIPVIIYFLPIKNIKNIFKYIFLLYILVPMSWQFTNNKCILTSFVKKNNEFKNTISDSEFSEKYLKWLYYPIIKICKKKWEKNNWINSKGKVIENKELIITLFNYTKKYKIKFKHVRAHQKEPSKDSPDHFYWYGNYMADKLANLGVSKI